MASRALALSELLGKLFDDSKSADLLRWTTILEDRTQPDLRGLVKAVRWSAPMAQVTFELSHRLEERGTLELPHIETVHRLLVEAFPLRKDEIATTLGFHPEASSTGARDANAPEPKRQQTVPSPPSVAVGARSEQGEVIEIGAATAIAKHWLLTCRLPQDANAVVVRIEEEWWPMAERVDHPDPTFDVALLRSESPLPGPVVDMAAVGKSVSLSVPKGAKPGQGLFADGRLVGVCTGEDPPVALPLAQVEAWVLQKAAGFCDRLKVVQRTLEQALGAHPGVRERLAKSLGVPADAPKLAERLPQHHADVLAEALLQEVLRTSESDVPLRTALWTVLRALLPYVVDWRAAQVRMREHELDAEVVDADALTWELPLIKEASAELLLAGVDERDPQFEVDRGRPRGATSLPLSTLEHVSGIVNVENQDHITDIVLEDLGNAMVEDLNLTMGLNLDDLSDVKDQREEAAGLLADIRRFRRDRLPYIVMVDRHLRRDEEPDQLWELLNQALDRANLGIRRMRLTGRPQPYERRFEQMVSELKPWEDPDGGDA
ncbi:MAG: hypothetical protein AAGA48_29915 [Myxococcota bacterium]